MAHQIEENDTLFAVGKTWHGLGVNVKEALTSEQAIATAGLDWKVNAEPMYLNDGRRVPDMLAHVCQDNRMVVGYGSEKYKILQNSEAFNFVDDLLKQPELNAQYESAGSLFNRHKVWLLARLQPGNIAGDEIENYMFFTNSFDGTSSVRCGLTSVRIVCNNTLQMAIRSAPRMWSMRHTQVLEERKAECATALKLSTKYIAEMENTAQAMINKKISDKDYSNFILQMFPKNDGKWTRQEQKTIDSIDSIYKSKPDLQNFKGTAWGVFQAVSDYASNIQGTTRNGWAERRFNGFIGTVPIIEQAQLLLAA